MRGVGLVSVTVACTIHAQKAIVYSLYADYSRWSTLYPTTIKGVELIGQEGSVTVLDVHHREGHVINRLRPVSSDTVELEEFKRRYDGTFVTTFQPGPGGTTVTVTAHIRLKGFCRVLSPFLRGLVRARIRRYLLEPLKAEAERYAG
jgi:Polyketide cyclase / dehydrase and lipid transport